MPATPGPKAPNVPMTAEQVAGAVLHAAIRRDWWAIRQTNADAAQAGDKPTWLLLHPGRTPLLVWCKTDDGWAKAQGRGGFTATQQRIADFAATAGVRVMAVKQDNLCELEALLEADQ